MPGTPQLSVGTPWTHRRANPKRFDESWRIAVSHRRRGVRLPLQRVKCLSVEDPGLLRRWNARQGSNSASATRRRNGVIQRHASWLASDSDELALCEVATGRLRNALPQSSWVAAIDFSRDGRQLVTGHDDGAVRIWEVDGKHPVRELQGHSAPISALAVSPDGTQLAAASEDRTVLIWDVPSGRTRGSLKGHTDRIQDLAWHPRGAPRLVSAGWDTTARVWDTNTFEPVILLNNHADQVTALAFSPDASILACADSAHALHLWEAEAGKSLGILKDHDGDIRALAFSPDSRFLASAGDDRVIHRNPRELRQLSGRGNPSMQRSGLAISADGSRLITPWRRPSAGPGHGNRSRGGGTRRHRFSAGHCYSADNRWIAGGSLDHSIRLMQRPANGSVMQGQRHVAALAFSPIRVCWRPPAPSMASFGYGR